MRCLSGKRGGGGIAGDGNGSSASGIGGGAGKSHGVWMVLVVTMLGLYGFERVFHLVSGVNAEPLRMRRTA